jgi:hypothetical protein
MTDLGRMERQVTENKMTVRKGILKEVKISKCGN